MLQLCHALLTAGDRSTCLSLLPQALLPAGFGLLRLTPNSCLVAALQELLPVAAKHGECSRCDVACCARQPTVCHCL
jgi:hypothetical protein